jgi:hypothetical protein
VRFTISFSFVRRVFSKNKNDVTTKSWISIARGESSSTGEVQPGVDGGLTSVGVESNGFALFDSGVSGVARTRREG